MWKNIALNVANSSLNFFRTFYFDGIVVFWGKNDRFSCRFDFPTWRMWCRMWWNCNGSVNSKRAHPSPGICHFGKAANAPRWGRAVRTTTSLRSKHFLASSSRKLGREQKKKKGRGRGRGLDWKRLLRRLYNHRTVGFKTVCKCITPRAGNTKISFSSIWQCKAAYRIFSIKRRTPIKRRPRLNAGSKLLIFK